MAAGQGATEYIDLQDFSPGIQSGVDYTETTSGADGAAQIDETYGCFADPNGGLRGLPSIGRFKTQTMDVFGINPAAYPGGVRYAKLLGTAIMSPVKANPGYGVTPASIVDNTNFERPDFVFTIYQWYFSDDATLTDWKRKTICYGWKEFQSGTARINVRAFISPAEWALQANKRRWGFGSMDVTMTAFTADPKTQPGAPILVASMYNDLHGPTDNCFAYPDPTTQVTIATDTTLNIADNGFGNSLAFPSMILTHQARVLFIGLQRYRATSLPAEPNGTPFGVDGAVPNHDFVNWTPPNNVVGTLTAGATFAEEFPTGIGSTVSMSASDLFLVKDRGGGVLVKGSIDAPQVIKLPGVASTHGAANKGCLTEKGYVYGTRHGVYLWNGSTTSDSLSPNLEGWFWKPDDNSTDLNQPGASHGQFCFSFPFVFAPNNFVLDMRNGAWFRLAPTKTQDPTNGRCYQSYEVSANGLVYAFSTALYDQQTIVWDSYDPDGIQTNKWVWKSQPLNRTKNRKHRFRELIVVGHGRGTIKVDLFGLTTPSHSSPPTDTHTFAFDTGTEPEVQVAAIALEGHDITVRLTSTGTGGGIVQAPDLIRMSIGYQDTASVPKVQH